MMDYSTTAQAGHRAKSEPSFDFEADYRSLTTGVGYRLMDERLVVRMVGDDRVSFLNGMCSNDIKQLVPGMIVQALLLTEHAHVLADLYVWAKKEALLLETDRTLWPNARAQIEKCLVADDVEIEELPTMAVIDIEGPQAGRAVSAIGAESAAALEPWHHRESGRVDIANLPRFGRPAFTVIAEAADTAEFAAGLNRAGATLEIREVSAEALDVIRIENGVPRVGVDTTEKTIALEARLQSAISFNKGCYVGQETIERATARGALKKRLFGLRLQGARVPEANASVLLEGKEVGRVTSACLSPRLGVLGLGILHHSAWNVGAQVTINDSQGEIKAEVSELPF